MGQHQNQNLLLFSPEKPQINLLSYSSEEWISWQRNSRVLLILEIIDSFWTRFWWGTQTKPDLNGFWEKVTLLVVKRSDACWDYVRRLTVTICCVCHNRKTSVCSGRTWTVKVEGEACLDWDKHTNPDYAIIKPTHISSCKYMRLLHTCTPTLLPVNTSSHHRRQRPKSERSRSKNNHEN